MRNVTKKTGRNGEVSYLIRVSAGYDVNGKQIKKSMTWKPSSNMTQKQIDRELEKQAIVFEEKIKNGGGIGENIKFSDYAEKWLEIKKSNFAPITYTRYKNLLIRINEGIRHIRINKLQSMHLNDLYNNLKEITSEKLSLRR